MFAVTKKTFVEGSWSALRTIQCTLSLGDNGHYFLDHRFCNSILPWCKTEISCVIKDLSIVATLLESTCLGFPYWRIIYEDSLQVLAQAELERHL